MVSLVPSPRGHHIQAEQEDEPLGRDEELHWQGTGDIQDLFYYFITTSN
jgi:hypothetical protein